METPFITEETHKGLQKSDLSKLPKTKPYMRWAATRMLLGVAFIGAIYYAGVHWPEITETVKAHWPF